jgi:hypothetical protein
MCEDRESAGNFFGANPARDHQVRAAFRAAGYSAQEVEGFTEVVEVRIAELNRL